MAQINQTKITDNLLNVYNYSFVETIPYGFLMPRQGNYVPVNLVDKTYHCPCCNKEFNIKYHYTGITWFSRSRVAAQQDIYEKLGLEFPQLLMNADEQTDEAIANEQPFHYHVIGYCPDCAKDNLLNSQEPEQKLYNQCRKLHGEDELARARSFETMTDSVNKWIEELQDKDALNGLEVDSINGIRDLICAIILEDTTGVEKVLNEYISTYKEMISDISAQLKRLPEKFNVWTGRSTALYESMSDDIYHEYTVVFPEEGELSGEFFINRTVEKDKVELFLNQRRYETIEDILLDVGVQDAWVTSLVDKILTLQAKK